MLWNYFVEIKTCPWKAIPKAALEFLKYIKL